METAPLKSFATWARKELIREVTARIAVVLAPAATERVEQPNAVEALEKAVTVAGGGDKGKATVADRVAYTWFNRIIALRFMDAGGYTGVGVVSPQPGVEIGQPEILAEAKRGNFDTAVIGSKTRDTVTGLLNGTRRSDDPQGEAYALLLADYCRFWNGAMPFMFEREGDFTELLIPADLLADDSVPSRAVKVLTKDVCQDVEVIGWLYQFYISERKAEVFAGFKKNKKAGADEIPAATQLFTPHWIVRYLVENSLGRLWMLNHPSSRLVDQMQYYIAPVDKETDFLKIARPEELKVVDPACGSGHMLTYAFDLLYAIYEEEGYAPAEIPSLILTYNLYGVEIDPRAGALAAFALTMKARAKQRTFFNKQVEPNVCILDPISFTPDEINFLLTRGGDKHAEATFWNQFSRADLFGSLIQPRSGLASALTNHLNEHPAPEGDIIAAEVHDRARRVLRYAQFLSSRYPVIVANPPYMGGGSMEATLAEFAVSEYRKSKSDLFAMFIERCISLGVPYAFVGMITMQSWLFISTYEALRISILEDRRVVGLLQLGTGAFDTIGGAVVSTAAFVIEKSVAGGRQAVFADLTVGRDERSKSDALMEAVRNPGAPHRRVLAAEKFVEVPGAPFAHAIQNFDIFTGPRISDSWRSGGRLKTHDGSRFIRYWWEVSRTSSRWRPLIKGGDFRPFYGNRDFVVDWSASAVDFYRSHGGLYPDENRGVVGVCWTKIGRLSFRIKNEDEEFDSASPTLLPDDKDDVLPLLAYLNSSEVRALVTELNPTINTQVANVLELPAPNWDRSQKETLAQLAADLVARAKREWEEHETADGFAGSPLAFSGTGSLALSVSVREDHEDSQLKLVDEIDAIVGPLLGTGLASTASTDLVAERPSETDLVKDLASYAVGCMFGRYSLDEPGLILADQGSTVHDYLAKVPTPAFAPDRDNVIPIVDGDWFEDDIVARFRSFLRAAFGEQHFEENLRFVTESLGVRDIREYFVKTGTRGASSRFYDDHVQRYKKRPIYWLFSSPKGSFNALIYMHRYTPSTVSTVLNEYLREFRVKLSSSLQQQDRLAAGAGTPRQQAAAQKEADRLRKVLLELEEYEHDVLYPLASRQPAIDLDDGVKVNYPKFGEALKKIPGLEASDE